MSPSENQGVQDPRLNSITADTLGDGVVSPMTWKKCRLPNPICIPRLRPRGLKAFNESARIVLARKMDVYAHVGQSRTLQNISICWELVLDPEISNVDIAR